MSGVLGAAGFASAAWQPEPAKAKAEKKLRVLILGGTGFLGPACTESLLARGHEVTLFNRGMREAMRKERGRPSQVPEGVQVLYGNRDPDKRADEWKQGDAGKAEDSPKGLVNLEGKTFDAVIDTSGYYPRHVKASAELLGKNVKQYVFISTISVYAANDKAWDDETAAVGTMPEGKEAVEEMGPGQSYYGPLKALCEQAAEAAMPGRVTNIRPGFIIGTRDSSQRFAYWANRIAEGGEVLVPGDPTDPMQVIDVRDLSDFVVRCIERGTVGVFNATGPAEEMTAKQFVEGIAAGVKGVPLPEGMTAKPANYAWASWDFLEKQNVALGAIPLFLPPGGETAGFHRRSVKKAVAAGLTYRPISATAKETLEWLNTLPADLRGRQLPQTINANREESLLAALKKPTP